jgi:hypothetical protein
MSPRVDNIRLFVECEIPKQRTISAKFGYFLDKGKEIAKLSS